MNILAIIPARGGSDRLPHKNILELNGRPLITYTFDQAKASKLITRIILATDDDQIERLGRDNGVEIVHLPSALTAPDRPMPPVIQWVMLHLEKYGEYRPNIVVLLQPTSPLRMAEDIDACIEIVRSNQADSLTTVCDGKENGAVYVMSRYLAFNGILYGARLHRYEMPKDRSVDVDSAEDLAEAERIMKGGENDTGGMLRKLDGHSDGKGDDKSGKGKRRRRSKVPTSRPKR
jgi:CMP-N-acetylneuraminic acid synthetase